jgi:hypothetical protein
MIGVLHHTLCRVRPAEPHDAGPSNRLRLDRVLRGLGFYVGL